MENPQGFNRANIYGKFHTHLTPRSELGLMMGAFTSAWNASGQLPQRAIDNGLITRWGAIDDLEGGTTGRYNISVDYHFMEGYDHDFLIQAYMSRYDFKLYSNFTLWLNDPVNGDMIEQTDHRTIRGPPVQSWVPSMTWKEEPPAGTISRWITILWKDMTMTF